MKDKFLHIFAIVHYKDIFVDESYRDRCKGWHVKVLRNLEFTIFRISKQEL